MEKKKWLWKRKSSERSPGESESSGSLSFSSPSERYSDEQDASRESPNGCIQSPDITSKLSFTDDEMKDNVKRLTEKLSAALVNVSAKEDLVKQHAKVAEEAVAGWEKAENKVAALKEQLEVAVEQNSKLEARVSHLDGALKECVRQLRQSRDEQEKRISDAIAEKQREWEYVQVELEKATANGNSASTDSKSLLVESIEKENSLLKHKLESRCKQLESLTIERDLSIQAAETASKLQLETIKKVAKLEAECRRLQSVARKSSPANNLKSSLIYAESMTDSHSDSGERLNAMDVSNVDHNGSEPSCSDSWASALIAELDQFKNEKLLPRSFPACSVEIDMMDDFLEMERLAALPDTKSNTTFAASESESISMDNNPLRGELDSMIQRVAELENKLEKMEAEKSKLETALDESEESLTAAHNRMAEAETKLEELQKELKSINEAKESLESHLVAMEVESRTMSANIDLLNAEIRKERTLSAELSVKYQELEQKNPSNSNGELKIKQEDLAVAADKLAECQKTIASLGRQLKSLATLEDFLIDTSSIPGFSAKVPSNDRPSNVEESSALLTSSVNQAVAPKSRNSFGKFFSRSKSGVELGNRQE